MVLLFATTIISIVGVDKVVFKYYVSVLGVGGSDSNVKSYAEYRKIIHEHSPLCIPLRKHFRRGVLRHSYFIWGWGQEFGKIIK